MWWEFSLRSHSVNAKLKYGALNIPWRVFLSNWEASSKTGERKKMSPPHVYTAVVTQSILVHFTNHKKHRIAAQFTEPLHTRLGWESHRRKMLVVWLWCNFLIWRWGYPDFCKNILTPTVLFWHLMAWSEHFVVSGKALKRSELISFQLSWAWKHSMFL